MIGKVLLSLLIGALVGGFVYVALGLIRRRGSGDSPERRGNGGDVKGKKEKMRPVDKEDGGNGGKAPDKGLTPTKEWFGGFRE